MESVWNTDIQMPQFSHLEGDLHTDVLIIGGGLAGILCTHRLNRAGIQCTLIEADRLMCGVSGRTTAKLTAQHGLVYEKLIKKFGIQRAQLYWQANREAIEEYRRLSEIFDFDYIPQNSYIYATDGTDRLEKEMAAYERLGIPGRWVKSLSLPFMITGAISLSEQAQFHPMKFAAHMVSGLQIFEKTKAMSFVGNHVLTPKGTITAEKIIVATHFPMINKHGAYFLKLYQQRSYIIALENAPYTAGMYLDCGENGLSVRQAGRWLLLGGGGHRTGKQGFGWALPEAVARKYYPYAKIVARWATQDCMTLDSMPYIGRYSKATPDLYVATGFQKWGMSAAMMAAMVLCDLICGKENPYADVFSPSRSMLHGQLFYNGMESVANLLRPSVPRCPHMGCALRWNKAERSWDCSCHGSRFDENGRVLNNPSTDDMKRSSSS